MPTVTIVTSTYNRADVVRGAIESVLAQDYTDWEMCVVGDCTPDDTAGTVASYNDPRLHYYNLPEKSPEGSHGAIAKNHAIFQMATSPYITYLDDDDEYLPNFLSVMVAAKEAHPDCPVVYCRAIYRDKDTRKRILGNPFPSRAHRWSRANLMRYNYLVSNGVLHTREIIQHVGGWNPDDYFDDYDLWKRMAAEHEFHFVDQPLCVVYTKADPFILRLFRKGWKIVRYGRRLEDQG